jgi:hypothetical protein
MKTDSQLPQNVTGVLKGTPAVRVDHIGADGTSGPGSRLGAGQTRTGLASVTRSARSGASAHLTVDTLSVVA